METPREYALFRPHRAFHHRVAVAIGAVWCAVAMSSCEMRRDNIHAQTGPTATPTPPMMTPTVAGWSTDTPEANMEPTLNPTQQSLLLTPWPTRFISYSQRTATSTLLPGPTETEIPTPTDEP